MTSQRGTSGFVGNTSDWRKFVAPFDRKPSGRSNAKARSVSPALALAISGAFGQRHPKGAAGANLELATCKPGGTSQTQNGNLPLKLDSCIGVACPAYFTINHQAGVQPNPDLHART